MPAKHLPETYLSLRRGKKIHISKVPVEHFLCIPELQLFFFTAMYLELSGLLLGEPKHSQIA